MFSSSLLFLSISYCAFPSSLFPFPFFLFFFLFGLLESKASFLIRFGFFELLAFSLAFELQPSSVSFNASDRIRNLPGGSLTGNCPLAPLTPGVHCLQLEGFIEFILSLAFIRHILLVLFAIVALSDLHCLKPEFARLPIRNHRLQSEI